jgi:hypothetical protein
VTHFDSDNLRDEEISFDDISQILTDIGLHVTDEDMAGLRNFILQ